MLLVVSGSWVQASHQTIENENEINQDKSDLNKVLGVLQDFVAAKTETINLSQEMEELRAELRSLKADLRNVKTELDSCLETQTDLRQHENDHVTLHLLQDTVRDLREELTGLAKAEEERRKSNEEGGGEEPWEVEVRSIRTVTDEMNIRQELLEAKMEDRLSEGKKVSRKRNFNSLVLRRATNRIGHDLIFFSFPCCVCMCARYELSSKGKLISVFLMWGSFYPLKVALQKSFLHL